MALHALVGRVAAALTTKLGLPLSLASHLLDGTVMPARALHEGTVCILLELGGGTTAVLDLPAPVAVALTSTLSGARPALQPAVLLTRAELAAAGYLALVAVSAARSDERSERRWRPRLLRVTQDLGLARAVLQDEPHLVAELRLRLGQEAIAGRLMVPTSFVHSVFAALPPHAPIAPSPLVLAAEVRVTTRLRGGTLSRIECQRLRPGDVVVLPELRRAGVGIAGAARVLGPGFELTGAFDGRSLLLSRSAWQAISKEKLMRSEPPPTAAELSVHIEIELARVPVPLSQLAALAPGQVLPLGVSCQDPVTVRIGERAIARAELVDVEGEVAARILALLPDSDR